jgi:uncharacterized protein YkwD
MRRTARLTLVVSLIGALLLALAPHAPAAPTLAQRAERRLLNLERREFQRPKMNLDRRLSGIARRHSHEMARRNRLFHNPRLVSQVKNRRWSRLGENVGVAPNTQRLPATLRLLHQAFMDSAPHRKNVLFRQFRKAGVGIARADGKLWVTVVFLG